MLSVSTHHLNTPMPASGSVKERTDFHEMPLDVVTRLGGVNAIDHLRNFDIRLCFGNSTRSEQADGQAR